MVLSKPVKKTKVMIFGTHQKLRNLDDFHLSIDGQEIERVESFK